MSMRYACRAIREYADANLQVRQEERAHRSVQYHLPLCRAPGQFHSVGTPRSAKA